MSKRRTVLQLEDAPGVHGSPYRQQDREPTPDSEDNDGDTFGDMPTPERLVTPDMLQPKSDLDNKVANFLAEIDALDDENSRTSPIPMTMSDREEESLPRFHMSPTREGFIPGPSGGRDKTPPPATSRSAPNAYSNMFVKGTPEFTKKKDEKRQNTDKKVELEPWPEEPKTDWQQLIDESTKYPYYWNVATNEVVWDIPAEFSAYLLRQKEYEEKVERGLREGKLDPAMKNKRGKPPDSATDDRSDKTEKEKTRDEKKKNSQTQRGSGSSESRHRKCKGSGSEDSSEDSSDSEAEQVKGRKTDNSVEVPSSSTNLSDKNGPIDNQKKKARSSEGPVLPDSTDTVDKGDNQTPAKISSCNIDDSVDFDIDDIDKELELALERKRKESSKSDDRKKDDRDKDSKDREGIKKKDHKPRRDDRRHDDERRKHKHRDHDRDRDRDHKHRSREEKEEKPKLTLKERLRIEMELKMEKERRKKKAIEEMMSRELEKTVGGGRSLKRHRDDRDEPRKRERYSRDDEDSRSRDGYGDVATRRGYDPWDRDRRAPSYEDRLGSTPYYKPPPPTEEMVAYKEKAGLSVTDQGRSSHRSRPFDVDLDDDDSRTADQREIEMKKLEALQLAELALSKLEFLEVTKKGLSKLQILLIELETRHQDWQAGGLTTQHFLEKLRGANWQLEQYEGSAAPSGWVCSWDRDYRRYFYTHKHTGKTQWDYPDKDDIQAEEEKMVKSNSQKGIDTEPEISSSSDRVHTFKMETELPSEILANVALPPPPPPPAEEHPSVKSLMLMYGSSSDSEGGEEEVESTRAKKKQKTELDPMPPLPPLPSEAPTNEGEKEKKDKHKKKKKKEKSKKREKTESAPTVGPMLPTAPPSTVPPPPAPVTAYGQQEMVYPNNQPPPPGETYYPQQMVQSGEVYGSAALTEIYGQNDQPLEFGSGPEPMEYAAGVESGPVVMEISQPPQVAHPPELYAASSTVGQIPPPPPPPAEPSEALEGIIVPETSAAGLQNMEEKKKKKKSEKMGSANISLKKKHVSSMVQKWQKVKKEVELEERDRAIREAEIRKKLAELE